MLSFAFGRFGGDVRFGRSVRSVGGSVLVGWFGRLGRSVSLVGFGRSVSLVGFGWSV